MAKLLGLLFEVTEIFDMQTRPELVLLQKTMVVVEGVARRLDPEFDMWTTAEPVVREWIERNLGAAGRLEQAGDALARARPLRRAAAGAGAARRAAQPRSSTRLPSAACGSHPATVEGIGAGGRAPQPLRPRRRSG